jgi:hypothetical protein
MLYPLLSRLTLSFFIVVNLSSGVTHAQEFSPFSEFTPRQQALLDSVLHRVEAGLPTPAYCVRGEITPEATSFINRVLSIQPPGPRFNGSDFERWTTTATEGSGVLRGDPITLTWSIVPDGTDVDGPGTASDLIASFDAAFGSRSGWVDIFQEVFDGWQAKTGITYVFVGDDGAAFPDTPGVVGERGDIRIGGTDIDGPCQSEEVCNSIIGFNYFPNLGDMVLDTANAVDTFAISDNNFRYLRNTVSHEHGHGLGFKHSCPLDSTKIMEPKLNNGFDHSGLDDIANANRKYADAYESSGRNDSPSESTYLGTKFSQHIIGDGSDQTRQIASLDSVRDEDFYEFGLGAGATISFTLRPQGAVFQYGDDNGSFCGTVSTFTLNSLETIDLNIQLIDSDGVTVIADSSGNSVGLSESVNDLEIPNGGVYFLRVFTNDAEAALDDDQVQLYELEIDVIPGEASFLPASDVWSQIMTVLMLVLMAVSYLVFHNKYDKLN